MIRGCYLFAIGLIMLALTWGPHQIWQWDILTLMGFATIVLSFAASSRPGRSSLEYRACCPYAPAARHDRFHDIVGGKFLQEPVVSRYVPGILLYPATPYDAIWSGKRIAQGSC